MTLKRRVDLLEARVGSRKMGPTLRIVEILVHTREEFERLSEFPQVFSKQLPDDWAGEVLSVDEFIAFMAT